MNYDTEHLYRVSIDFSKCWERIEDKSPIYVVSTSKEQAKKYVEKHLKKDCSVKTINKLGRRLGVTMFRGK